jgi:hypothetical protein
VGVGVTSPANNLKTGDIKCFDEWCAGMLTYRPDVSQATATVNVRLDNHGRRTQKSVLARAFIQSGGQRIWPQNPGDLQVLVPAEGSVDVQLNFAIPARLASPRFVVTAAASGSLTPGVIVIGDESSPFHPIAGWLLNR